MSSERDMPQQICHFGSSSVFSNSTVFKSMAFGKGGSLRKAHLQLGFYCIKWEWFDGQEFLNVNPVSSWIILSLLSQCAPWKSQIASSSRHSFQLCAAADGSKLPEVNNQSQDAPLTNNELRCERTYPNKFSWFHEVVVGLLDCQFHTEALN